MRVVHVERDAWPQRMRFGDAVACERRYDRPYDEQDVAVLLHPNGSTVGYQDRELGGVLLREVVALYSPDLFAASAAPTLDTP